MNNTDIDSVIKNFAVKKNIDEILVATSTGLPIGYFKNSKRKNKFVDMYVLSAKTSSLMEIAKTLTPQIKEMILQGKKEKIIVIGNDTYVMKLVLRNGSSDADLKKLIPSAKRIFTKITKALDS